MNAPAPLPATPHAVPSGLWAWRYILLRRVAQFSTLLLFFGTAHWGWQISKDTPLLTGNLSASEFIGFIPLADPFAALQIFASRHVLQQETLIGAAIVMGVYLLIGGRVFCAWVCPVNPLTDAAAWLRGRLGLGNLLHLPRSLRYFLLAASLVLSAISGLAAFEWVSPIGMAQRELIFGLGSGLYALLAIFLFDLLVLRHGWCGHLCPLGAFYGLAGKTALLRVRFDASTCTHCGECAKVCPEPQVLNLTRLEEHGYVFSGECSNCGRCTPICPEGSLKFDFKPLISRPHAATPAPVTAVQRRT